MPIGANASGRALPLWQVSTVQELDQSKQELKVMVEKYVVQLKQLQSEVPRPAPRALSHAQPLTPACALACAWQ